MADDLGILDPFHGPVECLDSPVLEAVGPGELVELNEIHAEGGDFQDVFVNSFGDVHRPVTAGLVVEVVGALSKHLDTRVLHLRRLIRGLLESFGLLQHDRSAPPDLLGQSASVQSAVDGEAQVTTLEVITQAHVVIVEGLVTVVIGMQASVGDDVQPCLFLIVSYG